MTLPNGAPDDIKYTYDVWDRLVRFEQNHIGGRNETYVYNGLNWRIRRTLDPGTSGGTAQDRQMFYSFDWKLLEEFIDDNYDSQNPAVDRHMQYIWGPRYADDIICRRVDTNLDGFSDEFYYHLTDVQFSSVAIVDESGAEFDTLERISYDPYGLARHHQFGDLDGDGDNDASDATLLAGNNLGFGVGDLNRDGVVLSDPLAQDSDEALRLANEALALPFGQLSDSVTDSIVGFDGYLMSAYDTAYLARNRYYEPDRGRWLNRDPAGYADGMSMYEYGMSSPAVYTDPTGLFRFTGWNWNPNGNRPLETLWRTFSTGRVRDSILGEVNGVTAAMNPFGGGIGGSYVPEHSADYRRGQSVGNVTGHTANLVLLVSGVHAGVQGVRSLVSGIRSSSLMRAQLAGTPWSIPLVVTDGTAVATSTVEAIRFGFGGAAFGALWENLAASTGSGGYSPQSLGVSNPCPPSAAKIADQLLAESTQVRGKFPQTAKPNQILVRRAADGTPTHYQVYGRDGLPIRRVDLTGRPHGGVNTPHVVEYQRNINPNTGEVFVRPNRSVRPARPDEIPGS